MPVTKTKCGLPERSGRSFVALAGFLAVWVGTLRAVRRRERRARERAQTDSAS